MNAKQFRQVIETIVKEEVRKEVSNQLPKILFEMLGQQARSVVREQVQSRPVQQTRPAVRGQPTPQPQPQTPKAPKRYAKDPVLNQILNETTPGLPQTPYDQGVPLPDFDRIGDVSEEFKSEMRQILSEDVEPSQMEVQEPPSPTDMSRLFNKNFKAILDKSKEGHGGGFSGVLQNW